MNNELLEKFTRKIFCHMKYLRLPVKNISPSKTEFKCILSPERINLNVDLRIFPKGGLDSFWTFSFFLLQAEKMLKFRSAQTCLCQVSSLAEADTVPGCGRLWLCLGQCITVKQQLRP